MWITSGSIADVAVVSGEAGTVRVTLRTGLTSWFDVNAEALEGDGDAELLGLAAAKALRAHANSLSIAGKAIEVVL